MLHDVLREPRQAPTIGPAGTPQVVDFIARGLGDRSYLLVAGDRALMVDPQRDVEAYLTAAEAHGARLTHVLETHVHNDYVSGGLELARRSGATLVLPSGSGVGYTHRPAHDGERFETGSLRIHALHTPGHTPEHTSYLVERGDGEPALLFSGGSLLAGSAGRTDLAGPSWTDRLTAAQFASVRRLAALPGDTVLHPTHGPGSFCTAAARPGDGFGTIAGEREANPALLDDDPLAFARRQLRGLLRFPAYYAHMGPINRSGSRPLGAIVPPQELEPDQVASLASAGIPVIDGRPRAAFAEAHVPGSLSVELDESFASYVGWLLPFDSPLALVLDRGQDAREAVRQLARIGFDHMRGVLRGLDGWAGERRPLQSIGRASVAELRRELDGTRPPLVLDVRQPAEWDDGVIPGSVLRFVADLGDPATWLPAGRPVWVICRSGHRAAIGASILAAAGFDAMMVDAGGVEDALRT